MPHVSKNTLIAGGHYYEYDKTKWTKVSEQSEWVKGYYENDFKNRDLYKKYVEKYGDVPIEYIEQDPVVSQVTDTTERLFDAGYTQMIIFSNIFLKANTESAVKFYSQHPCEDKIAGYIGCTWRRTLKENEEAILEQIELIGKAKREYYPEEK